MNEVWERNYNRLLDSLEEDGINTLIIASQSNLIYTTGIRDPTGVAVLSRNCGYTLITPILDYHRIQSNSPRYVEVKASYRRSDEAIEADIPKSELIPETPVKAALKMAKECGGVIGTDYEWQHYVYSKVLYSEGVMDASKIIARVRMIKSNLEIELIMEAIRIAEKVLSNAVALITEGVTEASIAGHILKGLIEEGWGWAVLL